MSKKVTWLHLSDLHFRVTENNFERRFIYDNLLKDLKRIEEHIDFVFVTGDIAYSGCKEEYALASDFFNNVLKILNLSKDAIFFVPGNHDIQRSIFANNISKMLADVKSEKEVSEILGNKGLRELFLKKLDNYYDFVGNNAFPIKKSELSYTKNININGIAIAIVGLNSSWSSTSSAEKGNIILGERQVLEAFSKIQTPHITFTLLHHPVNYFKDEDVCRIESIINSRSDFVLHGHIHNQKIITQKMPDSIVHYLVAGASYDENVFNLYYNYVSADIESGIVDVWLRKFDSISSSWVSDKSYDSNGKIQFPLPQRLITEKPAAVGFEEAGIANTLLVNQSESAKGIERISIVKNDEKPLVIPTVPKQLLNCIKDNKCVLFAGAGASIDAKMPSWNELVVALVERLKEEYSDLTVQELEELEKLLCEEKYIVLASYCLRKLGTYEFSDVLKQKLSCSDKKSLTHEVLGKIPFKAIITTNFDVFIELTNAKNGKMYKVILPNEMNLSEENLEGILPILKIHGSYENPDSFVLNKAEIRELLFHNPIYIETLKKYFTENTLLFYGYSFKDQAIDFVLQSIMADKKGMTRKHYALLPNVGKIEAEYLLQEYNIQVISFNTEDNGYLPAREFLQKIVEQL